MDTMEVLTLLLVIFAALSFVNGINKKRVEHLLADAIFAG